MTTRGIRRKKSYLVDAKIAVCGQKSVGKSGRIFFFCVNNYYFISILRESAFEHGEAKSIFIMMKKMCIFHLEPFFLSTSCL
jgi:hypothetical protein